MSTTQQKTRGALGVEAASWAWLLLATSLVLIGTAARPAFGSTKQDDR
jgi:hypothetical protein